MFGPVRRITRPASSSSTSFGMKASRAIMRSTTGWRLPSSMMVRSEEHTSELQSRLHLVCRLLLEKKKKNQKSTRSHILTRSDTGNTTVLAEGRGDQDIA